MVSLKDFKFFAVFPAAIPQLFHLYFFRHKSDALLPANRICRTPELFGHQFRDAITQPVNSLNSVLLQPACSHQ